MRLHFGIQFLWYLVIVVSFTGCFNLEYQTRTQTLNVVSNPPGALIKKTSSSGRGVVGQTPMIVEERYITTVKRFKHWNWVWPPLFALTTAAGIAAQADSDPGNAAAVSSISLIGLITTLIIDIVGTAKSGKEIAPAPSLIQLTASHQHYLPQMKSMIIPSSENTLEFSLYRATGRKSDDMPYAPPVERRPPPFAAPPPHATPQSPGTKKGFIVAVFDVEDAASRFDEKILVQLTEYLSAKVTEELGYRVIPRNQLKARLVEEKTEGYKKCYDESCQIELGKALSAEKSLATKLLQIGNSCAISSTLYDLKSEATEKATSLRTDCSENALMEGMEKIAKQLGVKR